MSERFVGDTIFALSSGGLPSGVAVIRLSGSRSSAVVEAVACALPVPRRAVLRTLRCPQTKTVIDRGLVLWLPGPASFAGEDSAEFHLHGGRAVVAAFLDCLGAQAGCRMAEAGEFSRRAFENGRLDLTEVEGLADLIAAETEMQRRYALEQSAGRLRQRVENWRERLINARALIEAELDFADEADVPGSVSERVWADLAGLLDEITGFLDDGNRGEIVRRGFRVALLGPPNAGKSSLMNALAARDIAIVSSEAGTTRDVLEVSLDIAGYPVIVSDTAGIRESESTVEREGMRRAVSSAQRADLVFWLAPADAPVIEPPGGLTDPVIIRSKRDLARGEPDQLSVSTTEPAGLDDFVRYLMKVLETRFSGDGETGLLTRHRHRSQLEIAAREIAFALEAADLMLDLRSEHLRLASDAIGRITGRIDVEDLLDHIFSEFCVGK